MAKKKNNSTPEDSLEIIVSSKPGIEPAKEIIPDQEILNKPIPKRGMGLLESWNSSLKGKK